jgi:hypothetical protein
MIRAARAGAAAAGDFIPVDGIRLGINGRAKRQQNQHAAKPRQLSTPTPKVFGFHNSCPSEISF